MVKPGDSQATSPDRTRGVLQIVVGTDIRSLMSDHREEGSTLLMFTEV